MTQNRDKKNAIPIQDRIYVNGGGRGIRTPEGLCPADLQSESFGQLGYPTKKFKKPDKMVNFASCQTLDKKKNIYLKTL